MSFQERCEELYCYNCNPELIIQPEIEIDIAQRPLTQISREMNGFAPALILRARQQMRTNLARELSVKVATRPVTLG